MNASGVWLELTVFEAFAAKLAEHQDSSVRAKGTRIQLIEMIRNAPIPSLWLKHSDF